MTAVTNTITLNSADTALILASLRRSSRPSVRKIADVIRGQVVLPLCCPVAFKTSEPEMCGDFTSITKDSSIEGLRDHLMSTHEMPADVAEWNARITFNKWAPPAV